MRLGGLNSETRRLDAESHHTPLYHHEKLPNVLVHLLLLLLCQLLPFLLPLSVLLPAFHLVMKSRSLLCFYFSSFFSPSSTRQPLLLWGVSLINSYGV